MPLLKVLAGALVLMLGRRLFWLFVGVVGFAFGIDLADHLFRNLPEIVRIAMALGAGLVGAVLAYFLQEAAVAIAGFWAGGYIGVMLVTTIDPATGHLFWVLFLIGGIIGAVVLLTLFDWALIVLSSLLGASFILEALHPHAPSGGIIFLALTAFGVVVQARALRRGRLATRL